MNYEKKYIEALERAKDYHKQLIDEDNSEWASEIEKIFPELAESEDEMISREITKFILTHRIDEPNDIEDTNTWLAWLEKQGQEPKKVSVWKHWKNGIAGGAEGEQIFLIKTGNIYSISSCLGCECDYIELSELDNLMLEKQGKPRQITHEEICKCYGIPDIGEFSDGYHTFNGLYKQRMILFAVLVKTYKDKAWKSWKHEDGELCFGGGWFIVGIDTPAGTYTYHYEARDWDRFDCQILEKGKHWDGHDESDVERLFTLVKNDKTFDYENAAIQQKDFAPKPEPKFRVGDWVVLSTSDGEKVVQIDSVEYFKSGEPRYITSEGRWFGNGTKAHLWIIQDAKDGDVLALNGEVFIYAHRKRLYSIAVAHCFVDSASGFYVDGEFGYTEKGNSIHPATKEQRDLLFQKMNEAGYEWDEDKKEIRKIEKQSEKEEVDGFDAELNALLKKYEYLSKEELTECLEFYLGVVRDDLDIVREEKPKWTEEDKENLRDIIGAIHSVAYQTSEDEEARINWLKSLKQRMEG